MDKRTSESRKQYVNLLYMIMIWMPCDPQWAVDFACLVFVRWCVIDCSSLCCSVYIICK